jgi:hypothetical protein
MINHVSSSASAAEAATNSSQTATSAKTRVDTPFGEMLVNEQSKPDLQGLFTTTATAAPAVQQDSATAGTAAAATPTLDSVFGSQPFLADPGGTGPRGTSWNYNPIYFATQATAEKVASMIGGTVVEENAIVTGGPFKQTAPNEMIQLADGTTVNAGLIANFFNHGYPQSYINSLLANVKDGEQA